jgi:CO/xanthine dehydrogenase Mo-binding subunit
MAASEVRKKIVEAAGLHLGREPLKLTISHGRVLDADTGEVLGSLDEMLPELSYRQAAQPFVGMGHYVPNTQLADPETKYGNPSPTYPFAAHVAEVEVDTETGEVRVTDYVAANDVGKAINPLLVRGQIEGGVVQGIGYALTEGLIFDCGEILNRNLSDYKIPTTTETPNIIPLIVEEEDPNGPYGAKSVGEPAMDPVAAAICNAIYNAVGVRVKRLPVTGEALLKAIKAGKDE